MSYGIVCSGHILSSSNLIIFQCLLSQLDVHYLHDLVAFNSSIGLTPTPLLEFAAAIGSRELSLGAEIGFDSASASFTKYNAGLGFNKHDFSAALML